MSKLHHLLPALQRYFDRAWEVLALPSPDAIEYRLHAVHSAQYALEARGGGLRELSEHKHLVAAIQAHPATRALFTDMIGTPGTFGRPWPDTTVDDLLLDYIDLRQRSRYSRNAATWATAARLASATEGRGEIVSVAHLPGVGLFDLSQPEPVLTGELPLRLGPGLSLDFVTLREARGLRFAQLYEPHPPRPDNMQMGVCLRLVRPVVVYTYTDWEQLPEAIRVEMTAAERRQEAADILALQEAVETLRLFAKVAVSYTGILTYGPDFRGGLASSLGYEGRSAFGHFVFRNEMRGPIRHLFTGLRATRKFQFVNVARRRFATSLDRQSPEDAFIDVMIACEALFLGRSEGSKTATLARRVAASYSRAGMTTAALEQDIRKAYGRRSDIVHGDHLPSGTARDAFITEVQEHLELCREIVPAILQDVFRAHESGANDVRPWMRL
jgi:hypothetical protein